MGLDPNAYIETWKNNKNKNIIKLLELLREAYNYIKFNSSQDDSLVVYSQYKFLNNGIVSNILIV